MQHQNFMQACQKAERWCPPWKTRLIGLLRFKWRSAGYFLFQKASGRGKPECMNQQNNLQTATG